MRVVDSDVPYTIGVCWFEAFGAWSAVFGNLQAAVGGEVGVEGAEHPSQKQCWKVPMSQLKESERQSKGREQKETRRSAGLASYKETERRHNQHTRPERGHARNRWALGREPREREQVDQGRTGL
jgi:hypothetical protein